MRLVLLTHPAFLGSYSHQHLARMLVTAYRERGHQVELRRPQALVQRLVGRRLSKWGGYIDQYLIFPRQLRRAMRTDAPDTLYVFCDQALGPWVPLVAQRPHVVHCIDLMALRSALGDIAENPTSLTGRIYQRLIRRGFRRARHFISVSEQSRADLHRFGGIDPLTSEMVHLGLNRAYRPLPMPRVLQALHAAGLPAEERGCLLHVGGGQWYKNSVGVVRLYAEHVRHCTRVGAAPLPLWLVSPPPDAALRAAIDLVPAPGQVRFCGGIDDELLEALYSHARALLFPSLAEGFGWPIVEALACGCPVITTDEAPMNEIGGEVVTYLPRLQGPAQMDDWAKAAAHTLAMVLSRTPAQRQRVALDSIAWAQRFDGPRAIENHLAIYQRVLAIEAGTSERISLR